MFVTCSVSPERTSFPMQRPIKPQVVRPTFSFKKILASILHSTQRTLIERFNARFKKMEALLATVDEARATLLVQGREEDAQHITEVLSPDNIHQQLLDEAAETLASSFINIQSPLIERPKTAGKMPRKEWAEKVRKYEEEQKINTLQEQLAAMAEKVARMEEDSSKKRNLEEFEEDQLAKTIKKSKKIVESSDESSGESSDEESTPVKPTPTKKVYVNHKKSNYTMDPFQGEVLDVYLGICDMTMLKNPKKGCKNLGEPTKITSLFNCDHAHCKMCTSSCFKCPNCDEDRVANGQSVDLKGKNYSFVKQYPVASERRQVLLWNNFVAHCKNTTDLHKVISTKLDVDLTARAGFNCKNCTRKFDEPKLLVRHLVKKHDYTRKAAKKVINV
jgi:hypothetical protein